MLRTLARLRTGDHLTYGPARRGGVGSLEDFEQAFLGQGKTAGKPNRRGKQEPREGFRHGVRSAGRPAMSPSVLRNRGREDQELFGIIRQHEKAIEEVGQRGGGALPWQKRGEGVAELPSREPMPGDYVERLSLDPGSGDVGVVLPFAKSNASSVRDVLVVTGSGNLDRWSPNDVILSIPQFVSRDLAAKADPEFVPFQPEDERDSDVMQLGVDPTLNERFDQDIFATRSDICARIRVLLRQTYSQQQLMSPHFGTHLFVQQRAQTKDKSELTAARLAEELLLRAGLSEADAKTESAKAASVLAAHRLMMDNTDTFVFDEVSHRTTNTFSVRKLAERKAVQRVFQWMTEWVDNGESGSAGAKIIEDFFVKAKSVIASRPSQMSAGDAFDAPSIRQAATSGLAWNENELDILTFLRVSISSRRRLQSLDIYGAYAMSLAKGCGYVDSMEVDKYSQRAMVMGEDNPSQLRTRYIWQLLLDVGAMAPWEDVADIQIDRSLTASIRDIGERQAAASDVLDEGIRTDYDAPVYVIDDASATELDDGISIERTGDDDVVWIHTHIADPTIGLQPGDELSEFVRRQHSTIYLVARRHDMLPANFASLYGLQDSTDGKTCNSLCFSAKVKLSSGSTLDTNVGLSRLKDVRVMTYDAATKVLREPDNATAVDATTRDDLLLLSRVARVLSQRRLVHNSGIVFNVGSPTLSFTAATLPASPLWKLPETIDATSHFCGFPRIEFKTDAESSVLQNTHEGKESNSLVAEFMILSGRVAGAWLAERGLAGYFRTQDPPSDAAIARVDAVRRPGEVMPYADFLKANVELGSSMTQPKPGQHFSLGIDTREAQAAAALDGDILTGGGYVRASSPLRRYNDLAMHWQIKNALRGKDKPVFSMQDIVAAIPQQMRMDKWIKSTSRLSTYHWATVALQRGQLYREMVTQGEVTPTTELDNMHASALRIIDGEHEAVVALSDIRLTHTLEEHVRVQLLDVHFPALCVWKSDTMGIPAAGQRLKVRLGPIRPTGFIDSLKVVPV